VTWNDIEKSLPRQQIKTTQLALREDMSQARNILVTKRDMKAFEDRISSQLQINFVAMSNNRQRATKKYKPSMVAVFWRQFRIPLGLLNIQCDYNGSSEEGFLSISYNFVPAPWLSEKGLNLTVRASFGRDHSPTFVQELTTTRIVPDHVQRKVEQSLFNFNVETLQDQIDLYDLKPNDSYRGYGDFCGGNIMHVMIGEPSYFQLTHTYFRSNYVHIK
jgi:hypothetical protein